jgi:hypothetical protein
MLPGHGNVGLAVGGSLLGGPPPVGDGETGGVVGGTVVGVGGDGSTVGSGSTDGSGSGVGSTTDWVRDGRGWLGDVVSVAGVGNTGGITAIDCVGLGGADVPLATGSMTGESPSPELRTPLSAIEVPTMTAAAAAAIITASFGASGRRPFPLPRSYSPVTGNR